MVGVGVGLLAEVDGESLVVPDWEFVYRYPVVYFGCAGSDGKEVSQVRLLTLL
jgi:hypothetical protein